MKGLLDRDDLDVSTTIKSEDGSTISIKSPKGSKMELSGLLGNAMMGRQNFNTGGMINRPSPTPVADNHQINVTGGEFVVNQPAAQKYHPLLEKMNNEGKQMLAQGGWTNPQKGYAYGGKTNASTWTSSNGVIYYVVNGLLQDQNGNRAPREAWKEWVGQCKPDVVVIDSGILGNKPDTKILPQQPASITQQPDTAGISAPGHRGARVSAVKGSDQYAQLSANPNYQVIQDNGYLVEFGLKQSTTDTIYNQNILAEDQAYANPEFNKQIGQYKFYEDLAKNDIQAFKDKLRTDPNAVKFAKEGLGWNDQQVAQAMHGTENTDVSANIEAEDAMSSAGGPSNVDLLNRFTAENTVADLGKQEVVQGNKNTGFTFTYVSGTTYDVQTKAEAESYVSSGQVEQGAKFRTKDGFIGEAQ